MKRIASLSILLMAANVILPMAGRSCAQARAWPPAQGLDLKQVALFKNGLGFFVGETVCPADRTDFYVILPAAPSHGTFWISYPSDIDLVSAVARETEWDEKIEAMTIPELLAANVGRRVLLTIGEKQFTGTITHCAVNRTDPVPLPSYSLSSRTMNRIGPAQPRPTLGAVTIQTETGLLCANPDMVTHVVFAGDNVQRQFTQQIKKTELQIRLQQAAPGQKIAVTFLARGVTWAPSYMVEISDTGKARLSAKAVVINDACKLSGVDVQLVTAFPHLQFSGVVSPMAKQGNLESFLQALSRRDREWARPAVTSNVMVQSVAYARADGGPATPEYGTAEVGAAAEDLFLYPAGSIDLDRSEVAYIPLFTESVLYQHIYQWDIPDYVNEQDRYRYGRDERADQDGQQEIWHSLRLTNTTRAPWTTAPGETVKNGTILGQDTLKYTPPGGQTTLRITRAIGVKGDQVELETARQRNARMWRNQEYDWVTIKGELSVLNTLAKPITLEITKTLSGEAKSVDPKARQEKLAKGLRRVNPLTRLTWTIELAPNAERNLTYTYDVYVR